MGGIAFSLPHGSLLLEVTGNLANSVKFGKKNQKIITCVWPILHYITPNLLTINKLNIQSVYKISSVVTYLLGLLGC